MQHIVIVGATSLIAEHCARLWVSHATRLTLAGRNRDHLERIANDLRVRNPQSVIETITLDFLDRSAIENFVTDVDAVPVDIALIAHGTLPDQKQCENELALAEQSILINAVSPALFAEAFAQCMAQRGNGKIATIGSVAGDRGRRSNYIYGASKGLVDRYLEGMRHRFAGTGVHVITIKPGPTRTPMTENLANVPANLAEPQQVARDIVQGIAANKSVIYSPGKWRLIMLVIRHIPATIFNRLNI